MTLPDTDELAGGADRDPFRLPVWLRVALALVAAAVLWFVLARTGGPHDPTSSARGGPATPTTSAPVVAPPEPASATGYPPLQGPLRSAGELCVRTQLGRTMTVQFELENAGPDEVTVLSISAHLPIGGLIPTGGQAPATSYCGAAVDPATSTVLRPGERVPVSLGFWLPPECPKPYPVQADVAVAVTGFAPTTQRLALLNDLGGYDFPSCLKQ
jgi:hypothetical protein